MGASAETPVLAQRYQLEEAVASGGTGVVWRAWDQVLDRTVAVKLLRPEFEGDDTTVQRLRREATAAAALTHPNAVIVYDIGEDDGRLHLVMEWVDGPSLEQLLTAGPLPPEMVATIGHDVARALAAAHARGLVHRDVKPSNILVSRDGIPKIADFGIATALGPQEARLTTDGSVIGTARYLSPEQLANEEVDGRSDVYALGLVLHRALTGQEPFGEGTAAEIASRRLAADLPAPSETLQGVPAALDQAIVGATRRDRDQRLGDAAALADVLTPLVPRDGRETLAMLVRTERGAVAPSPSDRSEPPPPTADSTRPLTVGIEAAAPTTPIFLDADTTAERPLVPAGTEAPSGEATSKPPRVPRWLLAAAGALVVAALVALALGNGRGQPAGGGATGDGGSNPMVLIKDAGDLDPLGDGREHPDDVPLAFDGDPSTAWRTETYNQPNLGGRKSGVGIWFDLGEPVRLSRISVALATSGVDFQVYAANEPFEGTDPSEHGRPIGPPQQAAAGGVKIDLDAAEGRYFAIWISRVAEGRAEITEIAFERA